MIAWLLIGLGLGLCFSIIGLLVVGVVWFSWAFDQLGRSEEEMEDLAEREQEP